MDYKYDPQNGYCLEWAIAMKRTCFPNARILAAFGQRIDQGDDNRIDNVNIHVMLADPESGSELDSYGWDDPGVLEQARAGDWLRFEQSYYPGNEAEKWIEEFDEVEEFRDRAEELGLLRGDSEEAIAYFTSIAPQILADIWPHMPLWHVTLQSKLDSIQREGFLRSPVYLATSEAMRDAYHDIIADFAEGSGDRTVALRVWLKDLNEKHLHPDDPGIEEPQTYSLGMKEKEVWDLWEASGATWVDSMRIIESVCHKAPIPWTALSLEE